jgi:hypothetical protein
MGLDGRIRDGWSRRRGSVGVLVIAVMATGCVNPFVSASRRPVLRPVTTQTGSDRLRDHAAQAPPQEVRRAQPATLTPAPQPEPQPPSSSVQAPPLTRPGEPDPRAVIDWLLKERR